MGKRRITLAFFLLLAGSAVFRSAGSLAQAHAKASAPPVAWEHQFLQNIDWYIRTSAGILIVRSGDSLTAIDGTDGKQLWVFTDIAIEGESVWDTGARGANLMEVPDLSILLINRARVSPTGQHFLLGVDLWTGKVLWQQPELDSLWDLVPLQNSGRILLLTLKDTKERKTAAIGAAFVPYVGFGTSAVAAAVIPLRLEMISLDPRSGQTEWTSQYSRPILPAWFDATEAGGKIYVSDYDAHGFSILASVDASSGQTLWEYKEPADFRAISAPAPEFNSYDGWWAKDRKLPPPVQFTNGRAVFAAQDQSGLENLQDLDLASQKPVWTAKDLGKIRGLIVDQDLVLVSADDGAFGIAADSGAVRWTFKAQGQATNPVSFKDDNAVFLCDDINFTELDAATGKVLRQTPHHLGSEPDFIRQVDPKFIMAVGKKDAVLLNTATGESSARFPRPDAEFAPTTFWVSWENFDAISDSPPDLQRELRGRWPEISAEAGQSPEVFTWHTRVQSFITSNAGPLYANRLHGDTWRFRCVNPTTGAMHTFDLGGQHPDANSAAGLVYLIEDNNRLRAVQIPAN